MTDLWDRLERQLEIHAPELATSLRPGVGEVALATFEEGIGQRLPDDLREAYLRHDGCDHMRRTGAIGLFGTYRWLPLGEVCADWQRSRGGFDESDPYFYDREDGGWETLPIRPWQYPPPQWIPLGGCVGVPARLYIDMLPGPLGTAGQVVGQDVDSMSTFVFCSSLAEYLLYLLDGLERGIVGVISIPGTQEQDWVRNDKTPFIPPGCVGVFG